MCSQRHELRVYFKLWNVIMQYFYLQDSTDLSYFAFTHLFLLQEAITTLRTPDTVSFTIPFFFLSPFLFSFFIHF